ncbi:hypothetical protein JYU34_003025, partial [Plutella xylostella]
AITSVALPTRRHCNVLRLSRGMACAPWSTRRTPHTPHKPDTPHARGGRGSCPRSSQC